jgi:hypothetical protein
MLGYLRPLVLRRQPGNLSIMRSGILSSLLGGGTLRLVQLLPQRIRGFFSLGTQRLQQQHAELTREVVRL